MNDQRNLEPFIGELAFDLMSRLESTRIITIQREDLTMKGYRYFLYLFFIFYYVGLTGI